MSKPDITPWKHSHNFCPDFSAAEKNTRRVLYLTMAMMFAEIVCGLKFHSMALFADGLHMGTHVTAFLITVIAYFFARRHAADARFSFGTGKFGVLGAFTSAIILGGVGIVMAVESVSRLIHPLPIQFDQAILVACLGLAVNTVSALILKDHHHHHGHSDHDHHDHSHDHSHDHHHDHDHKDGHGHRHHYHHGHDLNLRSAYIHVIADAFTSLLAIIALLSGKYFGWYWMDAIMGIVGSLVIAQWAYSLTRQTKIILLDEEPAESDLDFEIRKAIDSFPETEISDLHIWQIGANQFAAAISLVTRQPQPPDRYKVLLKQHEELVHVTIEVNQCTSTA